MEEWADILSKENTSLSVCDDRMYIIVRDDLSGRAFYTSYDQAGTNYGYED